MAALAHKSKSLLGNQDPGSCQTYKKNVGFRGVMAMIQGVTDDAKALENEAVAAEQDAQTAYETFISNSNKSIATKSKAIAEKIAEMGTQNEARVTAKCDMKGVTVDLESLNNINRQTHGDCDFVLTNFDVRQDGSIARKPVAPKILSWNDKPYTEGYGIGQSIVVLYVMLAGEPPSGNTQPDAETLERIKKGKFDFDAMPEGTSEHVIDLIKNMILEKPEKRLSTSEAAHSPGCDPLNPDRMNATKNKKTMNMMRKFRNQGKSKQAALQVLAQHGPIGKWSPLFSFENSGCLLSKEHYGIPDKIS